MLPLDKTPVPSIPRLHQGLLEARNKREMIDAMLTYISATGGMSGASQEVWDKVNRALER